LSFNMRVLLSVGVDANDQNLHQRGALLYCVLLSVTGHFCGLAMKERPHEE
jgi:hypothetical protein